MCRCSDGYVGPTCTIRCPTMDGNVCGGHGACVATSSATSRCQCNNYFFGDVCTVYCEPHLCVGLAHAMCDPFSGSCVCLDSAERHFGGPTCEDCSDGYWGASCTYPCPCNSHGTCQRDDGECQCYAASDVGYWSPPDCGSCKESHIGTDCTVENIILTTTGTVRMPLLNIKGKLVAETTELFFFAEGSLLIRFNSSFSATWNYAPHVVVNVELALKLVTLFLAGDFFFMPLPINFGAVTSTSQRQVMATTPTNFVARLGVIATVTEGTLFVVFPAGNMTSSIALLGFVHVSNLLIVNTSCVALVGNTTSLAVVVHFACHTGTSRSVTIIASGAADTARCTTNEMIPMVQCAVARSGSLTFIPNVEHEVRPIMVAPVAHDVTISGMCSSDMGLISIFEPSTLATFLVTISNTGKDPVRIALTGLQRIDVEVVAGSVVTAVYCDWSTRIATFTMMFADDVYMHQVNLFSIQSVFPHVVDSRGGTRIVLIGQALNTLPLLCSNLPAQFRNYTAMECVTRSSSATSCTNVFVAATIGTRSCNAIRLVVAAAVQIEAAVPTTALLRQETFISIIGIGFVSSPFASCRLTRRGESPYVPLRFVRFVSGTTVVCATPPDGAAWYVGSWTVEYSHDGQVFSQSDMPLVTITTEAYSLAADVLFVTVRSTFVAVVPNVTIYVTDSAGNALLGVDYPNDRLVSVRVNGKVIATVTTEYGVAVFANIKISKPEVGLLPLVFDNVQLSPGLVYLEVTVGDPVELKLLNLPLSLRAPVIVGRMLHPLPVVIVVDAAGNVVVNVRFLPTSVEAIRPVWQLLDSTTSSRVVTTNAIVSSTGQYVFDGLFMRSVFDRSVEVVFKPLSILETSLRVNVQPESCDPNLVAIPLTFQCVTCPNGATCDGSSTIVVREGYWRAAVYPPIVYRCPAGSASCERHGNCGPGYEGPLCSVCSDGYGTDGVHCRECLPLAVNITVVVIFVLVVVAAVFFLSIPHNSNDAKKQELRKAKLVTKLLVHHAQVVSLITASLNSLSVVDASSVSGNLIASIRTIMSLNPNNSLITCNIARRWSHIVITAAAIPITAALLLLLASAAYARYSASKNSSSVQSCEDLRLLQFRQELCGDNRDQNQHVSGLTNVMCSSQHQHQDEGEYVSPRQGTTNTTDWLNGARRSYLQPIAVFTLVSWSIFFFFCYPMLVETGTSTLQCETISHAKGVWRLLTVDRTVDCDSSEYGSLRAWALVILVVFGCGIPLFPVAAVKIVAMLHGGNHAFARNQFFFMTGALKPTRWWWESVRSFHKALLVVIVTVVPQQYRSLVMVWMMMIYFGVCLNGLPWLEPSIQRLDIASCLCILLSSNMVLLANHSAAAASHVFVVVLVFNVVFLVYSAYLLSLFFQSKVLHHFLLSLSQYWMKMQIDEAIAEVRRLVSEVELSLWEELFTLRRMTKNVDVVEEQELIVELCMSLLINSNVETMEANLSNLYVQQLELAKLLVTEVKMWML